MKDCWCQRNEWSCGYIRLTQRDTQQEAFKLERALYFIARECCFRHRGIPPPIQHTARVRKTLFFKCWLIYEYVLLIKKKSYNKESFSWIFAGNGTSHYNNVCLLSQNQQTKMSNSNYFKFESLVLHTWYPLSKLIGTSGTFIFSLMLYIFFFF